MDSVSSPKRFLSGDDNYETRLSCERKKQKSGRDANTTVVDVSRAENDKSTSIQEKLQCKLPKNKANLIKTTLTLGHWMYVEENF